MKRLVCAKEVEALVKEGGKVFYMDNDTIITPSAKDIAKANGIEFSTQPATCCTGITEAVKSCSGGVDSDLIYSVLKTMMEQGLLKGMLEATPEKPYAAETDSSGIKVVRGNSVKMDYFDTGNPNNKVYFQELISKDESQMSAGFLTIENSSFEWNLTYEEIDYVIEGTLTVTIDGRTITAKAGDVLFVPSGSNVVWGSPDKARLFYTTYPANWADLM